MTQIILEAMYGNVYNSYIRLLQVQNIALQQTTVITDCLLMIILLTNLKLVILFNV